MDFHETFGAISSSINRNFYKAGKIVVLAVLVSLSTTATPFQTNCSSDPCMYGICLDDGNSSYSCYCIDGYTGINCEINWDDCWSNPCLNGGTCNDAVAAYNCTCTEGFVGVNCEQKYSECSNQPCLNNGTCLDYDGFVCQCPDGYSGDYCEIDASVCNETICKNSGTCVEGPGFSFFCRCPEGWTGKQCEEDIDECNVSPCMNGGLCINVPASYTCACLFGYTGKNCDKAVMTCEENPCENGAVCLLEDDLQVCYCVPDYHGSLCELRYDDCLSKFANCENGGSCIDGINTFTCLCPPPYTGPACAQLDLSLLTTERGTSDTSDAIATSNSSVVRTSTTPTSTKTTKPLLDTSIYTNNDGTDSTTEWYPSSSPDYLTQRQLNFSLDINTSSTLGTSSTQNGGSTMSPSTYSSSPEEITHGNTVIFQPRKSSSSATDAIYFTSPTSTESDVWSADTTISETPEILETNVNERSSRPTTTHTELSTPTDTVSISTTWDYFTHTSSAVAQTEGSSINAIATPTPAVPVTALTISTEESSFNKSFVDGITTSFSSVSDTDLSSTLSSTPFSGNDRESLSTETYFPTVNTGSTVMITAETVGNVTTPKFMDGGTYTQHEQNVSTPSTASTEYDNCYGIPCSTSTTTLPSENRTKCECPPQEEKCRTRDDIMLAAFNGKSYARQRVKIDVVENENATLRIRMKLRTRFKKGIILHVYFDDEKYALLYLDNGSLKFQFSCGFRTMLLGEIDCPSDNGYLLNLETRFQYFTENGTAKCSGKLLVNDSTAVSGEQMLLSRESLPRQANLHLGGLPLTFTHYFPHLTVGFVGCMTSLEVNGVPRHFVYDSIETFQLDECTSFLCLPNPCQNFGACEETNGAVRCKCIAGYTGATCERSACEDNPCQLGATCISSPGTGFLCVCPLGAHGLLCEEDTTIVRPSFSVILPGFSSYIAYGVTSSIKGSMELRMRVIPRTIEQISLIAYLGQSGSRRDSSDHLSVTYVRGYVMLTWDLGSGVRRIFTRAPLISSKTIRGYNGHMIRIGRRGRDAWLAVDGIGNVTGRALGSMNSLDVSPVLYIGGHKSKNFESLPHDLPLHTGFSGCIFDVELRTEKAVYSVSTSSPATGRAVGECHRNECIRHSCKNGALCLNHGPTYSCICSKDWTGLDCSIPIQTHSYTSSVSCEMEEDGQR